jgi:hypothetical protein
LIPSKEHAVHTYIDSNKTGDLEANDDVVLVGEDLELVQQLVQLHHRLAVLLRKRTGKKTIAVSARTVPNAFEYLH